MFTVSQKMYNIFENIAFIKRKYAYIKPKYNITVLNYVFESSGIHIPKFQNLERKYIEVSYL